jgi:hypothetical protein
MRGITVSSVRLKYLFNFFDPKGKHALNFEL